MIKTDMVKAKVIAHDKRREAREVEFKPLDEAIARQIPGNTAIQAEEARQAIRDKYAAVQVSIDNASTIDALLLIVKTL